MAGETLDLTQSVVVINPVEQGGVAWSEGIGYKAGDIVTDLTDSKQYTCLVDNTDVRPSTDVAGSGLNWEVLGGPAERGAIVDIPFNASLEIDMDLSNRFRILMTGDSVMAPAINVVEGQGGMIYFTQDATGGRTFDWNVAGTQFVFFDGATVDNDTTANKTNVYAYEVFSSDTIIMSYLGVI